MEVKFIDFQSARFASLATDLVLFLFTSVRVSHMNEPLFSCFSLHYSDYILFILYYNLRLDTTDYSGPFANHSTPSGL